MPVIRQPFFFFFSIHAASPPLSLFNLLFFLLSIAFLNGLSFFIIDLQSSKIFYLPFTPNLANRFLPFAGMSRTTI